MRIWYCPTATCPRYVFHVDAVKFLEKLRSTSSIDFKDDGEFDDKWRFGRKVKIGDWKQLKDDNVKTALMALRKK